MFTDTHTHHIPFSYDARQTLQELVGSAESAGLSGIMLTDHYDPDFPTIGCMTEAFDIDAGLAEWHQFCAGRPSDAKLKIHYGIEIGYLPHLADLCRSFGESGRFDGIILSLHALGGADPFFDTSIYAAGQTRAYEAYLDAYTDMMKAVPGPAIVGHYDYIARYSPFEDPSMNYADMPAAFDRFFDAVIETGKCLEFNVRSRRRRVRTDPMTGFFLPDPKVYQRYAELGGRMVSLGSDAHSSGESGMWFAESAAFLADCGIRQLTHFDSGKPCLTDITPPKTMTSES